MKIKNLNKDALIVVQVRRRILNTDIPWEDEGEESV